MNSRIRKLLFGALAALTLWGAPVAVSLAAPINVNEWYIFNFGSDGEQFAPCVAEECDLFGYGTPAPPWQITLTSAATLVFTDAFQAGDTFEISVYKGLETTPTILSSSLIPASNETCFTAADCLVDSAFAHIAIGLAANTTYTITGKVVLSPFDSGAGFFSLQTEYPDVPPLISEPTPRDPPPAGNPFPIPEPASLALLGLALVMVGGIRRGTRSH